MKIENIKIGADPEMFLYSKETNLPVPVVGIVGGTKKAPIAITDIGHALQEDNVMVEYCIPPCVTASEFWDNINFVKEYIDTTILAPKGLYTKCVASARFTIDDLVSKQAQEFGCDPDYNAWTGKKNTVDRSDALLRTAGGHIHVGYKNPSADDSMDIIKAMDVFLGVPSIILDTDTERRKVYGKAGAFRLKPYGVEYRTLSTFWTASKELTEWAFNATIQACDWVSAGGEITDRDRVIKCINTSDKALAEEIMDDYRINIPRFDLNELLINYGSI